MKIRTALLLIPVLLALMGGTALAKSAPPRSGIDPTFGHGGTIAVSVPKGFGEGPIQMATAPSGKSYVLDGTLLYAFRANGLPDHGFADHGHVQVAAASGETTEVTGLAVDAQGRVLAGGSVNPTPGVPANVVPPSGFALGPVARSNAFVIRYLPDGERDPTFGSTGEIDVTVTPHLETGPGAPYAHFESPIVRGDRLAVVNGEQPVLGGTYAYYDAYCRTLSLRASAFVGTVDTSGAGTQSLVPTTVPSNNVSDFAPMPAGNLAVLTDWGKGCGEEDYETQLSALTFGSTPAPTLDPARPVLLLKSLAVDGTGRFLGLEGPSSFATTQGWKLDRLLPNGDFDLAFGSNGGLPLKKFGEESVGAVVVGAKERPVVAGGDSKFRLVRLGTKGKVDHSFGKGGWLEVGFGPGTKASPAAMTIDAKGRLLVAGRVTSSSLKGGEGIALTRLPPGS